MSIRRVKRNMHTRYSMIGFAKSTELRYPTTIQRGGTEKYSNEACWLELLGKNNQGKLVLG